MGRRIEGIERIAIWTAHSKKCAYCEEPLNYADLEIEHIIPKSLRKKPTGLQKLIAQLALPADFDLDSLENLLPSHRRCNFRKKARIFSQANVRFFLEIAQEKLDVIKELIQNLKLEDSRENLLAMVQSALESGGTELGEILEAAAETHNFPLKATIDFESGTWEVRADREKINELLDEPVELHAHGSEFGVQFTDGKGAEKSIRTCREYRSAIEAGFYPSDNTALKISFLLATASAMLDAASCAKIPPISYIRRPRLGLKNLDLLPAQIAPTWKGDGSNITMKSDASTIQEFLEAGNISVQVRADTLVSIEVEDQGVALTELMRADFDDDGVEEILVKKHFYIKFGTLRSLSIGLLRKRDPDSIFEYESWDSATDLAQLRHEIARAMR